MRALLAFMFACFVVAFVCGIVARKFGLTPWVALWMPIVFFAVVWMGSSIWVFSGFCTDINACDSGGWLAMTLNLFGAGIVATIAAVPACYAAKKVTR